VVEDVMTMTIKKSKIGSARAVFVAHVADDVCHTALENMRAADPAHAYFAEPRGETVGKDWAAPKRLRRVRLIIDPRHTGRTVLSRYGEERVQWDGTGWKSDHRSDELEDEAVQS
jgi:hypothetical protein